MGQTRPTERGILSSGVGSADRVSRRTRLFRLALTSRSGSSSDLQRLCGRGCEGGLTFAGAPVQPGQPRVGTRMTQTDASQSRAGDLLAGDPACRRAGIELDEVGPGWARLRMRVADGM